jgi:hypothetical protein
MIPGCLARLREWTSLLHVLTVGSVARMERSVIRAGLSAFRVGADGKLDFGRKYDLDVGIYTQWWSGIVALA